MLCQPSRGSADCAPAEEVSSYDLLWDTFGVSGDIFGDFGHMVCGPVESITDECCYVLTDFEYMEWAEGRPFTVDGHARLAECGSPNGWAQAIDWNPPALAPALHEQLVAHWTETAQFEHASVASFARFSMQLMAMGAPAGLSAEATRAQSDEIRHARIALGIASTLSGEELGLASLPIDGALAGASDVRSILVDTIHEACVNETVSAAQCQAAGEASNDPFIKEALLTIAEDEQRHATLAWKTVRWILEAHPELRSVATEAFESAIAKPWGSTEQRGSEARVNGESCRPSPSKPSLVACYDKVVRPCADALLSENQSSSIEA